METTNPASKPLSSYPPGELLSSSSPSPPPINGPTRSDPGQYKECLRNHAASVGGNVVDGCGEFMPEPSDSLKCSVCGCHRSFHRKHTVSNHYFRANGGTTTRVPPLLALPPPRHPLNPPPVAAFSGGGGGGTTESSGEEMEARRRKRFRTRFTTEQKERMLGFAEAVGWRMHRKDDLAVNHFCREINVSRQVFKVWMHNNKHLSLSSSSSKRLAPHQPQLEPQPQQHQSGDECKDNERSRSCPRSIIASL